MATTVTDYPSLIQALKEASEDYSAEFSSYLPAAVGNAELRLYREFDIVGKRKITTPAVTKGTKTVTKPGDFLVARSVFWVDPTSGRKTLLKRKTADYLNVFWPNDSVEDKPRYYTEISDEQFVLAPTPSQTTTIHLEYEGRPPILSASTTTNIFTKYMPDLLFHASMVELSRFSRNNELLTLHEAGFQDLKRYMGAEAIRGLKDDGVVFGNPQGQSLQQSTVALV
jgi:hypothetical protein